MADSYRSVVEVLRCAEAREVLKTASEVGALWRKAANSDDLWRHFCTLCGILPCEGPISDKVAFREGSLSLKVSELPLVRPKSILRFSIPDFEETRVRLSTPVVADCFTAYCYLSLKRLLICGGGSPIVDNAYSIDLDSGVVTELAKMKLAKRSHAAYKYCGFVYVFGGFQGRELDSIEKYSISGDFWELLPGHLEFPMEGFVPARYRDNIYLVGAYHIEVFNTHTETCTLFPLSLPKIWHYCLTFITNAGQMVIVQDRCMLSCSVWSSQPAFTQKRVTFVNGNYRTMGTPVKYGAAVFSFLYAHRTIEGILRTDEGEIRKVKKI